MQRHLLALGASALAAALATPALADSCYDTGAGSGVSFSFNIHFGEPYTEDEENTFVLMELRRQGINATRVERWGGCYRAYVTNADGRGQHMEFFNAETLRPVGTGNSEGQTFLKLSLD